jgi:hypothetical protein
MIHFYYRVLLREQAAHLGTLPCRFALKPKPSMTERSYLCVVANTLEDNSVTQETDRLSYSCRRLGSQSRANGHLVGNPNGSIFVKS